MRPQFLFGHRVHGQCKNFLMLGDFNRVKPPIAECLRRAHCGLDITTAIIQFNHHLMKKMRHYIVFLFSYLECVEHIKAGSVTLNVEEKTCQVMRTQLET